jgi:hypothetical protein
MSFSKLLETVMQTEILKYLTKYNILSTKQYGFRIGLKTDNTIFKLTAKILNAMNNKILVGGSSCLHHASTVSKILPYSN